MKPLFYHILLILPLFLCQPIFAQKKILSDYYLIQRQYENLSENDETALPFVQKRISKAKREKNNLQLYIGYKDARYHSANPFKKLKYADSTIYTANKMRDDSLISSAYLSKGIVYYFNFKKYKLALDEYLKAFDKTKSCKDLYYKNKINYHIGVVRSYMGYYKDALSDFEDARKFFEREIKKDLHPNLMFGNRRGYYNTLHQMAVCYRNLNNQKKADSLIDLGLSSTLNNADFKQEYSYFLKEQGINRFNRKNFRGAIESIRGSLPNLKEVNDFAWLTICYSYLGKSHWKLNNIDEGIKEFEKVDSIFNKHNFVLPEVRKVYENLIDYYEARDNSTKVLYYMKQLLKVDSVLDQDFFYLSSKILRDYDTTKLLREQDRIESMASFKRWAYFTILIVVLVGGFYWLVLYRSRKKSSGKSTFLGIDFGGQVPKTMEEGTYRIRHYNKSDLSSEIVDHILFSLENFEKNKEYLQSSITLGTLAERLQLTEKNLSSVINEHKGASFNRYLSELRIAFITDKLINEPKYLKYSSAALARECGIASRSNFSALFREINGITFNEFIKKQRDELNDFDLKRTTQ
ncbi:helix-turn-helix domain-containing protein [Sphingobacterium sp.]|uniref:helix-turn-helix domain-containing protein n=1 Tax=Sphingobacterium sp. TaxID=341027 RepID=UPI002FD9523E